MNKEEIMQILFLSDTHGLHRKLEHLPPADLFIHAGDVSRHGEAHEVADFIQWFAGLDYKYKLFIAGNHDLCLKDKTVGQVQQQLPENAYYLCDSGICIEGIGIWGSPYSPMFHHPAFNCERGSAIRAHWELIPPDTDILITHGPPCGILDRTQTSEPIGCEDLLQTVQKIKPAFHLFGHVHESYGIRETASTIFMNGSILDEKERIRDAIQFQIKNK